MRIILLIWLACLCQSAIGQTLVAGKVSDQSGSPVTGASIFIKDSYDGNTSGKDGEFNFKTTLTGSQILTIECMGYKPIEQAVDLSKDNSKLVIVLNRSERELETVVIVAGSFDASDERKAVALKPMDIVTTASAGGDIYGALSTLPGTQTVGETGKLFVRGGEDYEARTFIDGLQVESPYQQRLEGIPTKGRFSPLLFSGTMFSTGGYSAEFGQALSSVVLLKTDGAPADDKLNINVYSLGLGLSQTKKLGRSSYIAALDYTNLGPYYNVVPQTADWKKAPQTISGTFNLINQIGKESISKTLIAYNDDRSSLDFPYYGYNRPEVALSLTNKNLFVKNTILTSLSNKTTLRTGAGFSFDRNNLGLDSLAIRDKFISGQFKAALATTLSGSLLLNYGADVVLKSFKEDIQILDARQDLTFSDVQSSAFTEMEYSVSSKLALRVGLRAENSSVISQFKLMPRASLAYRVSDNGQISAAYGTFYQNPQSQYLKFTTNLQPEEAVHYIVNYQYKVRNRLFRVEGFYKDYQKLITYRIADDPAPENYANTGYGYAQGIDVFYRDSESIKNGDFWFSYSYLDTKKLYRDYLLYTTPKFFSRHNMSIVYKQWIGDIKSFIGLSYTYASGRPYYDPNKPASQFLTDKTKPYNNLSVNYSYDLSWLTKVPVTFYASVSNVFGSDNIFGYNNAFNPSTNRYDLTPVLPQANRFYLVALFMSLNQKTSIK